MSNPIAKLLPHEKDFTPRGYIYNYLTTRDGVDTTVTNDTIRLHRELNKPIPQSYALFNKDGVSDLEETIKQIQYVQSLDGPIWEVDISVQEEDCAKYGIDKNEYEIFLRENIVKCLQKLGLKNIKWCAAMHHTVANSKEKHPHVHVLFWQEGEQLYQNRYFSLEKLTAMRLSVIKEMMKVFAKKAEIRITDEQLDYYILNNLPIESIYEDNTLVYAAS